MSPDTHSRADVCNLGGEGTESVIGIGGAAKAYTREAEVGAPTWAWAEQTSPQIPTVIAHGCTNEGG